MKNTVKYLQTADWRRDVVNNFEKWLYELTEKDVDSIPVQKQMTDTPDLMSFFNEMAALRQEVKLQSRSYQNSSRLFENVSNDLFKKLDNCVVKTDQSDTGNDKSAQFIRELIQVREGLTHALDKAESYRFPAKNSSKKVLKAVVGLYKSQKMIAAKIDDTMQRLGIRSTANTGMQFDPEIMKAVGISQDGRGRSGKVTQVIRQGYCCGEQIIQLSEVIVEK